MDGGRGGMEADELVAMFPGIDRAVLECVLHHHGGRAEEAVTALLDIAATTDSAVVAQPDNNLRRDAGTASVSPDQKGKKNKKGKAGKRKGGQGGAASGVSRAEAARKSVGSDSASGSGEFVDGKGHSSPDSSPTFCSRHRPGKEAACGVGDVWGAVSPGDVEFLCGCFPDLDEGTIADILRMQNSQADLALQTLMAMSGGGEEMSEEDGEDEWGRAARAELSRLNSAEIRRVEAAGEKPVDDGLLAQLIEVSPEADLGVLCAILRDTDGDVEAAKKLLKEEEEEEESEEEGGFPVGCTSSAAQSRSGPEGNPFALLEGAMTNVSVQDLDIALAGKPSRDRKRVRQKVNRLSARFPAVGLDTLKSVLSANGGDVGKAKAALEAAGLEAAEAVLRRHEQAASTSRVDPAPASLDALLERDQARQQLERVRSKEEWVRARASQMRRREGGGGGGGGQQPNLQDIRHDAQQYKRLWVQCIQSASSMRCAGDHRSAGELMSKGKEYKALYEEHMQRASDASATAMNRHRRNAHTHDLHGQTVQEAKRAVDTLLAVPLQLKSILDLRLIVGRGLHSGGGQAVLGPAILEYLKSVPAVKDVKYNPGNDGEILAVVDATGS